MLVYLKEPMGYTQIGNYRIYGRYFSYGTFGTTDIPWKLYIKHRSILEQALYTKEVLEEKFGGVFPDIEFRPSELRNLNSDDLIAIAHGIGIEYMKSRKKLEGYPKKVLCRHIRFRL